MDEKTVDKYQGYAFQYKRKNTEPNTCSSCEHFFDNKTYEKVGFCKKWVEVQKRFDTCNRWQQFESPFEDYTPNPFEALPPVYHQQLNLDF